MDRVISSQGVYERVQRPGRRARVGEVPFEAQQAPTALADGRGVGPQVRAQAGEVGVLESEKGGEKKL